MHERTSLGLFNYINSWEEERIQIRLKNLTDRTIYNKKGIIQLMMRFLEGSKIEGIISGEEDQNLLRDIAKGVGRCLNSKQRRLNQLKVLG